MDTTRTIGDVLAHRKRLLEQLLCGIRPDVFIIEHFPFSKWELRPELLATIKAARSMHPHLQVICSVRDHPPGYEVSASTERYRCEVVPTLNEYFTALLVHADPRVVQLEAHFPWVHDITIPIQYTGYVSQKVEHVPPPGSISNDLENGFVLVSSGGLVGGFRLATLCSMAWQCLHQQGATAGRRMVIFAGLFVRESQYETLRHMTGDGPFVLQRFSADFLRYMPAAGLSISQAGYNTSMNVLETRVRAILAPNRRTADQPLRAQTLAELGVVDVIDPETISIDRLAKTAKNHHLPFGPERLPRFRGDPDESGGLSPSPPDHSERRDVIQKGCGAL